MVLRYRAILEFILIIACSIGFSGAVHAELLSKQFIPTIPPHPVAAMVFQDGNGNAVTLRDFQGHYVLLNLWATWCGPCTHEMPDLDHIRTYFLKKNLKIVALNEDHDGLAVSQAFYARHNLLGMTIYTDTSGRAPFLLQAHGLPTTLLIDPKGMEIGRVEGDAEWASSDGITFLDTLLHH